jgi:ADP-heptose:LPS heptosyltransferase
VRDDLRLARRLRSARFDVAIDFHGGPRSAWLTWASRAPVRVGYDIRGRAWMYTHIAGRPRELRARHSVENQWDLLATLDPAFAVPADPDRNRVEMPVNADARAAVHRRLTAWAYWPVVVIVIHVSAGNPFRRWPEFHLPGSRRRSSRPDPIAGCSSLRTLRSGGTARDLAAARRRRRGRANRGCRPVAGRAARAFEDAALFVGGDSGPLHVAATSDVPVVGAWTHVVGAIGAVATATHSDGVSGRRRAALPAVRTRLRPDFRCLTGITAARVAEAAARLLEAAR